jgi:hypothetical protein
LIFGLWPSASESDFHPSLSLSLLELVERKKRRKIKETSSPLVEEEVAVCVCSTSPASGLESFFFVSRSSSCSLGHVVITAAANDHRPVLLLHLRFA